MERVNLWKDLDEIFPTILPKRRDLSKATIFFVVWHVGMLRRESPLKVVKVGVLSWTRGIQYVPDSYVRGTSVRVHEYACTTIHARRTMTNGDRSGATNNEQQTTEIPPRLIAEPAHVLPQPCVQVAVKNLQSPFNKQQISLSVQSSQPQSKPTPKCKHILAHFHCQVPAPIERCSDTLRQVLLEAERRTQKKTDSQETAIRKFESSNIVTSE